MQLAEPLNQIVDRLRRQGTDDALVEVKTCAHKLSGDVWETVSAFANTAGGLLILGLNEETGFTPVEGFELDRVRDQFISGIGDGGTPATVAHAPRYEMARAEIDGMQVLLIRVEELELKLKPCYIVARGVQNGSYKRIDDKDIKMSPSELYELQSALLPSDADGEVVPEAGLDDLDTEYVKAIIANRRLQTPRVLRGADSFEKQLVRLNIATKDGALKLAGVLAAGAYPQQFFPKLLIDVAVHPDIEKAAPGEPRFVDRQLCDGPISASIEDALAVIGRNLRKTSIIKGAGRIEEWEVPQEVLREALANACIHREYSPMFVGQSVSVDIYPDRIEIKSPGGLWGGKTLENLDDGESRCRNPRLMSLMGAAPLEQSEGTVAESQGSGIPAMIREMESRSLGRPRFIAKADSFCVVINRCGVELVEKRRWIFERVAKDLPDREETLLLFIRDHGGTGSVKQIRGALRWDSDDIRQVCGKLVDEGILIEDEKDAFSVAETDAKRDVPAREKILWALASRSEMTAREIAAVSGLKVSTVRYHLPKMVAENMVDALGVSTSRNRKYRLHS